MSDLPNNSSTTAQISVGESYVSTLGTSGDRDWVRLDMAQGESVTITMQGYGANAADDPFLRLYSSSSTLLTSNDDLAYGQQAAQITFTATTAGPYYIEAAGYNDTSSGRYQLSVRDGDSLLNGPLLSAINWGTQQSDTAVTVYFVPRGESRDAGDGLGPITSEGLNAYEKGQFQAAFDQISSVSGLTFQIVNDPNADLQIVLDTNEIPATGNDAYLGIFNPPGEANAGVGIFNGAAWDRRAGGDLDKGGYGYVTITHELLHGLGLAHPHDTGGSSTEFAGVSSPYGDFGAGNLNQGIFTTMSYNTGYATGTTGSYSTNPYYGYESGPMALDIAVLQQLYGTGGNYKTGNNVYHLATQNTTGTLWQAIWDTGGTDEIRASGNRDAFINLWAATLDDTYGGGGRVSAMRGIAGGYTIANGVVVENATGANGDDTLVGNAAGNKLDGQSGNDKLIGNSGKDVLLGRSGADKIFAGVGNDTLYGGGGTDILKGGAGQDKIDGGYGNDKLYGAGGADILRGGQGADVFYFKAVSDSASGSGKTDTITDFSSVDLINLRGIDGDDSIAGNQHLTFIGRNRFSGDAGEVRFVHDGDDLRVLINNDADGKADMEFRLLDANSLSQSDFLL